MALDDETSDRIDSLALELIGIVRDGAKHDIARITRHLGRTELIALAVSAASMVDASKTQTELLAWMDRAAIRTYQGWTADALRNAHAAFARGVRVDEIVKGEQIYQAAMYKRRTGSVAI